MSITNIIAGVILGSFALIVICVVVTEPLFWALMGIVFVWVTVLGAFAWVVNSLTRGKQ